MTGRHIVVEQSDGQALRVGDGYDTRTEAELRLADLIANSDELVDAFVDSPDDYDSL